MREILSAERLEIRPGYLLNTHQSGEPRGAPVILIHGAGSSFQTWENQIHALQNAGRYRIIAYDLDGHGDSDHQPHPTFNRHVDDLQDLLHKLQIRRKIVLVGHSNGAAIAQKFTLEHPHRVRRMVLLSAYDRVPPDVRTLYGLVQGQYALLKRNPQMLNWFFRQVAQVMATYAREPEKRTPLVRIPDVHVLMEHVNAFKTFNIRREQVPENTPKTLVICGDRDPLFAIVQTKLAAKWDAKHVSIPSLTHSPHLDYPEIVNRQLIEFIK